ncbi:MAG: acyl carrier protein [Bacteroidota bacterium]|nr:acyl carrier protein [Bacteroidota bacterium]
MNRQILNTIKQIFEKHLMLHAPKFTYNQDLHKDLYINEYELNEMLLYVENEFHIQIDDREIPSLHTVGDLVYCVQKHRAA